MDFVNTIDHFQFQLIFSLLVTFEVGQSFGLGLGIPRYTKEAEEMAAAADEGSSVENSRPFMSRYSFMK